MPLYAYKCPACGRRFEELVSMDKRDAMCCPDCGGEAERAWDAPGVFGVKFSAGCDGGCCSPEGGCPHACCNHR